MARNPRPSRRLVGPLLLTVLVAAGCGGAARASAPTPSDPTTATTPPVPSPITPAPITPAPVTPAPVTPAPTTPAGTAPTTAPGGTAPGTTVPGGTAPSSTVPTLRNTKSGTVLLHTVLADATAQQWVHAVSNSPAQSGAAATRFVSDDGPDRGTQDITVGAVAGSIRVIGDRTYILGSPQALEALFEVPADIAVRLGGVWVRLQPGDSEYHSVTIGVTIPSFLQEIAFTGAVTEGTTTLAGATVTVLEGTLTATAGGGTGALYLTAAAAPLPLMWEQIASGATTRTSFGDWGQAVPVTAPPGAVPLPAEPGGIVTMAALRQG